MENGNEMQQFRPLSEVQQELGICRRTLYERIEKAGISLYVSPQDHRRRLLAESDVRKLMEVRPVPRRETVAA